MCTLTASSSVRGKYRDSEELQAAESVLFARSQGGRMSAHGPVAGFAALQTHGSVPELWAPLRARAQS